jgi:murein DD-endopeptidase MepM/ murein hydrolase activator NlpD
MESLYGYTQDKSHLQDKINEYIKNGDGEHIAFVQIDNLPEYKLCLLKKDSKTNDDEIFEKVKTCGTVYYKYYAITESAVEKLYVPTVEEAEKTIAGLKEKNSSNKEKVAYIEKYSTELKEFTDTEKAIASLYIKPVVKTVQYASVGYANTLQTANTSGAKIDLGIDLIRPVSGTITSRFGSRGRGTHTGLDIANKTGTPIKAAASGTVTYTGFKGSYGNLVIISHGNGIQTYYAHCSSIEVKTGQSVTQGQEIAKVGSTGNSSGPHLHLEIRVDGVAQNPQNYLY